MVFLDHLEQEELVSLNREARKELQYLFKNSDIKDLNSLNVLFKNWGWSEGAILGYGNTKYFVNANKLLAGLMVDIKQKDITKFNSKQAKGRKVGQ